MNILKDIVCNLRSGNLYQAFEHRNEINNIIESVYNLDTLNNNQLDVILDLLTIGNIIYNNTDLDDSEQLIDNEVYDKLVIKYSKYRTPPVGGEVIIFRDYHRQINPEGYRMMICKYNKPEINEDNLYDDILNMTGQQFGHYYSYGMRNIIGLLPTTKGRVVKHENPNLVGTLDKVKMVLDCQAKEKGVYDDPNFTIMERDFFRLHFERGIIRPGEEFRSIVSLKYDGLSVEGIVHTVNGQVILESARTRGDIGNDLGKDITHVLYGYHFYNADPNLFENPLGVKFEAVMSYTNLNNYNIERERDYKNPRSAISSIINSDEGARWLQYVTLVPLETEIVKEGDVERLPEIEFINKNLTTGEFFRYIFIEGDFTSTMFQIKKFVEEMDYYRSYIPIMYDGVVFEYADNDIRNILGRKNSINQYAIAVKFNPLHKQTIFRGYKYTVGVNGTITPMMYFDPIDFYGCIHDHASAHSYDRFKSLNLGIGDILDVDYVNEVMPYATKAPIQKEYHEPEKIIEHCPICGTKLKISESGKSLYCPNINCNGRLISKMSNMISKLGIRDFSEKSVEKLGIKSFKDMMNIDQSRLSILGDINSDKFIERINYLKSNPIDDYTIIGSLGFSNLSIATWRIILDKISLSEILNLYCNNKDELVNRLTSIKGIGTMSAITIINEMPIFIEDISFILTMPNIVITKGISENKKKIRITGFRDYDLISNLLSKGYDVTDGSVTKDTVLLIADNLNTTSGKIIKAKQYNIPIVSLYEFRLNPDKYL